MAAPRKGSGKLGETPLTLRLTSNLQTRIDALLPKIVAAAHNDDQLSLLGNVTKSDVVRMALMEGVKALERRYQ